MYNRIIFMLIALIACISISQVKALEIVTVESQTDIKDYIKPGTWVFTDFDRTLMVKNNGTPYSYELNPAYTALLKNLQDNGVPVFGLTARGADDYDFTINQLKVLGLDFTKSLSLANITDLPRDRFPIPNSIFKDGILFTPEDANNSKVKTKGINLKTTLESFPDANRTIVVIDDQVDQLINIQQNVQMEGTLAYSRYYGHLLFKSKNLPTDFPLSFNALEEDQLETFWGRDIMRLKDKKTGKTYLIQTQKSPDQIKSNELMKEEIMALRLYEALGVPIPAYVVLNGRGVEMTFKKFNTSNMGLFLITEDFLAHTPSTSENKIEKNLRDYSVFDTFLSNTGYLQNDSIKRIIEHQNKAINSPNFSDDLTNTELKDQRKALLDRKEQILNTFQDTNKVLVLKNPDELLEILQRRLKDLQPRLAAL